jgi:hydroxymethylpyrimidine/phosphomethylpyrimidine kinase
MKVALTIAGSDSGGGAGIQADLKTFAALRVYGTCAVTSVTAQNTVGVSAIHDLPPDFVGSQIDTIFDDFQVNACKSGMLSNKDIISVVAEKLEDHSVDNYVLDPVMVATSGDRLLRKNAVSALQDTLIPLSRVLTPNIEEACILSGMTIESVEDMESAARNIQQLGCESVVIKGGRQENKIIDVFYNGTIHRLEAEYILSQNTHGTGCTFSSAIAAELAKDIPPLQAVSTAKEFIATAIAFSDPLGHGHGPQNHFAQLYRESEKFDIINQLIKAVTLLKESDSASLIPEVQSNLVMALPRAQNVSEVAGFPGRIVKMKDSITPVGCPEFGASSHMARVVLAAMNHDLSVRSGMNIRYGKDILEAAEKCGLTTGSFSRKEEPLEIKAREGSTLDWGTDRAITQAGRVPDLIFDEGGISREAMVRVLGKTPADVTVKVLSLLGSLTC